MSIEFKTYEELLSYLRNWNSFNGTFEYDHMGIVNLFEACLDNMIQYTILGEAEDLKTYFNETQKKFIKENII